MTTIEVLVIGAGIAGASLAWWLADEGVPVLVLERETQPGMHSSGRSAAMFMESYGSPGARALTRASHSFWLEPPPGFADHPLLHPRGALYVAAADQQHALDALHDETAATGTLLRPVGHAQMMAMVPVLRGDVLQRGLLDEEARDMDVDAILQGFLRGARRAGADIRLSTTVLEAAASATGWRLRLSDGSVVHARVVANAAGAWADEVALRFGVRPIGLQPCRRSAFTFAAPAGMDCSGWPMVMDVGEGWYLRPDAGQLLASPANADPVPPHDVLPEDLDIALAIDRIERATTLHIERPTASWAGLRNFVPDGELVIGFDDAVENFFWLAGQGGYGIQSAAAAGQLAASLLRRKPLPEELRACGVDPLALAPRRLR